MVSLPVLKKSWVKFFLLRKAQKKGRLIQASFFYAPKEVPLGCAPQKYHRSMGVDLNE